MKLYRMVPDAFLTFTRDNFFVINSILNKENFFSFEDILYELGYMSFIEKPNTVCRMANSFEFMNEKCKHFFLFPQDAIIWSNQVIGDYKKLGFRVLEYDFPLEEIYKYVGYGCYGDGDNIHAVEFLIPESYLRSKALSSSISISFIEEELERKVIEHFEICTQRLKQQCEKFYSSDVSNYHDKIMKSNDDDMKLYQANYLYQLFVANPNYIEELKQSTFFKRFFQTPFSAFKSSSLTNNIIYVSIADMIEHFEGTIDIMDIIKRSSKPVDMRSLMMYEEQNHLYRGNKIIYEMGLDSNRRDKEQIIKTLSKWI